MIELAIAVLWFLIGVIVLGFVVWIALWVLHNVFSNLPSKLDQAVWGIFAILCLIYALTLLAGGGRISFPRVGFISSAEAAGLTATQVQPILKAVTGVGVSAPDAVRGIITGGLVPQIIAGMTVLDTVAGKVNPDSKDAPPFNTYLPEAHQCIVAAIPWLQNIPTEASVPQPTNADGTPVPKDKWDLFTTVGMAEIKSDALQDFLGKLTDVSLKPLKMGCSAWGLRILNTPAAVVGNVNRDVANFVTIFAH